MRDVNFGVRPASELQTLANSNRPASPSVSRARNLSSRCFVISFVYRGTASLQILTQAHLYAAPRDVGFGVLGTRARKQAHPPLRYGLFHAGLWM
jgi:hypothetical protein